MNKIFTGFDELNFSTLDDDISTEEEDPDVKLEIANLPRLPPSNISNPSNPSQSFKPLNIKTQLGFKKKSPVPTPPPPPTLLRKNYTLLNQTEKKSKLLDNKRSFSPPKYSARDSYSARDMYTNPAMGDKNKITISIDKFKMQYIWYYYSFDETQSYKYSDDLQLIINNSFSNNLTNVHFFIKETEYVIFFTTMKQISSTGGSRKITKNYNKQIMDSSDSD